MKIPSIIVTPEPGRIGGVGMYDVGRNDTVDFSSTPWQFINVGTTCMSIDKKLVVGEKGSISFTKILLENGKVRWVASVDVEPLK